MVESQVDPLALRKGSLVPRLCEGAEARDKGRFDRIRKWTGTLVMPLPYSVHLREGESPLSYASRIAGRNNSGSILEFCTDFGIDYYKLAKGEEGPTVLLASLAGCDVPELLKNRIIRTGSLYKIFGQDFSKPGITRERIRACTSCLREDVLDQPEISPDVAIAGRSRWWITSLGVCPLHNVEMIDIAHRSNRGQYSGDFSAITYGEDVAQRLGELPVTEAFPTSLERYINGRLVGLETGKWIDQFPCYAAVRASEVFGSALARGPWFHVGQGRERDVMAARGFDAISEGIKGVVDALDAIRAQSGSIGIAGPKSELGYFSNWLRRDMLLPEYAPLRDIVFDYFVSQFPFGKGDLLFGKQVQQRQIHSVSTLTSESGMHPKRLRKMLIAGGLVDAGALKRTRGATRVPADEAETVVREGLSALTITDLATRFNCPRPTNFMLVREGYLKPLFPRVGHGGGLNIYISRAEIDRFFEQIARKGIPIGEPRERQVPIPMAAKKSFCSTKEVLDLLLADQLDWVGRQEGFSGFLSILVDADEVRARVKGPELPGYGKREVEKLLNISTNGMLSLIRNGLLQTNMARSPVNRTPQLVVTKESMAEFKEKYVTLFQLANETGHHHLRLKKLFRREGVRPVGDPVEMKATIYRRSELPPSL